MNIDFHHAVTYVVARYAGFDDPRARTVAHAAQYVDDATDEGLVLFDNGAMYRRLATAHRALDYKNFAALANRLVWIPFHFLPGNAGLGENQDPEGKFIHKLITRPNSLVAQALVQETIEERHRPYGLHRLGILAHVFVDTWAHQGFAGVNHRVNQVRDVRQKGVPDEGFNRRISRFFHGVVHQSMPPIGHGAALSYPDRPYLQWSYVNGLEHEVVRSNPDEFVEAADELCRVFRRFLSGRPDADVGGLPPEGREKIELRFRSYDDADERIRHKRWLHDVAEGAFDFEPVRLDYIAKGPGSWRAAALRYPAASTKDRRFPYDDAFLQSDWKLFHDAAKAHRRAVVDDVLPSFGICVA